VKSIKRYVANHGITIDILAGPDWKTDEDNWEHYSYDIQLNNADLGTTMIICGWRQGTGITEGPDERPESVFDCMIGDAWGYENARSFEEWAGEYGYDTDSRKAERIWTAVGKQTNDFLDFIGGKAELEKLALEYERL